MSTTSPDIDLEDFFDVNTELRIEEHTDWRWGYRLDDGEY